MTDEIVIGLIEERRSRAASFGFIFDVSPHRRPRPTRQGDAEAVGPASGCGDRDAVDDEALVRRISGCSPAATARGLSRPDPRRRASRVFATRCIDLDMRARWTTVAESLKTRMR
ncbi:MAG: hypothetical protein U1E48_08780 [Paracoccaceae bacterium]